MNGPSRLLSAWGESDKLNSGAFGKSDICSTPACVADEATELGCPGVKAIQGQTVKMGEKKTAWWGRCRNTGVTEH